MGVVERTSHTRTDVPAGVVAELEQGKVEPTQADAAAYVANIRDQVAVTGSPPTSTSTTPTTTGN